MHFMLHTKCGFGNRMERKIFTLRRKVTVIFPLRHFSSHKFLLCEYISLSLKLTTFVRLSYENIACQIGDDTKLKTLLWLRWGSKGEYRDLCSPIPCMFMVIYGNSQRGTSLIHINCSRNSKHSVR